jgi:hypothetical protein
MGDQFTNGIDVGDVVSTYHKGYWRVTKIERRYITEDLRRFKVYEDKKLGEEYSAMLHYELVADANFNPPKKKAKTDKCDAAHCHKITEETLQVLVNDQLEYLNKLTIFAAREVKVYPKIGLLRLQVETACKAMATWIRTAKRPPTSADVDHSALLRRLLEGKPLLPKAPPLRMSYPWYELGEGQKCELRKDDVYDNLHGEPNSVVVCQSTAWEWHDKGKQVLRHVPTQELYQLTTEGTKSYIEKVKNGSA